jgi:hypothetical protein
LTVITVFSASPYSMPSDWRSVAFWSARDRASRSISPYSAPPQRSTVSSATRSRMVNLALVARPAATVSSACQTAP